MPNRNYDRPSTEVETRKAKEEPTGHQQDLIEALVAGCAIVAYADGNADIAERRKLLGMMRRIPSLAGFSREDLAEEFVTHERAFENDPTQARQHALRMIGSLVMRKAEVRMLLQACQEVLEADGIFHPLEYAALNEIGLALNVESQGDNSTHG